MARFEGILTPHRDQVLEFIFLVTVVPGLLDHLLGEYFVDFTVVLRTPAPSSDIEPVFGHVHLEHVVDAVPGVLVLAVVLGQPHFAQIQAGLGSLVLPPTRCGVLSMDNRALLRSAEV